MEKQLSNQESDAIVVKIVRKVYKKLSNEINDQMKILCKKYPSIKTDDFIDIVLRTLVSLNISTISKIINDHKVITGNTLDIEKIFQLYIMNMHDLVKAEKAKTLKEGMN